jgi:hypothetical protein
VHGVDTHPGLLGCTVQREDGCTQNSPPEEETWMNCYTQQHKQYCGIDLHARAMYVCLLDQSGTKGVHKNRPTTPEAFLHPLAP